GKRDDSSTAASQRGEHDSDSRAVARNTVSKPRFSLRTFRPAHATSANAPLSQDGASSISSTFGRHARGAGAGLGLPRPPKKPPPPPRATASIAKRPSECTARARPSFSAPHLSDVAFRYRFRVHFGHRYKAPKSRTV